MNPSSQLLQTAVLISTVVKALKVECFSCASNANWTYYMDRIPGLKLNGKKSQQIKIITKMKRYKMDENKPLNNTETLPIAPLACTFDPMRIYADQTAVACDGYCIKWASVKILDDGGLEVNFLRGCFDSIMQASSPPPTENRCYQSPADFTHKVGVEYKSTCFCKGFMCNSTASSSMAAFLLVILSFLLLR